MSTTAATQDHAQHAKHQKSHSRALMHFAHLLAVSAAIYVSYITYGVVQEWMYRYTSPSGQRMILVYPITFHSLLCFRVQVQLHKYAADCAVWGKLYRRAVHV